MTLYRRERALLQTFVDGVIEYPKPNLCLNIVQLRLLVTLNYFSAVNSFPTLPSTGKLKQGLIVRLDSPYRQPSQPNLRTSMPQYVRSQGDSSRRKTLEPASGSLLSAAPLLFSVALFFRRPVQTLPLDICPEVPT